MCSKVTITCNCKLYPKPGVLDTATRLMTAQSKGCTAMLLGQDCKSKYSLTE